MNVPVAPVLLKEATSDKNGILVSWIAPSNAPITSFTLSWKAESWWQSATATVPNELRNFLISDIPANEKISVYIYATNDAGSSAWSDSVDFVSARDCGQASTSPDIYREVDLNVNELFDLAYTQQLDHFAVEKGIHSNVNVLSYEVTPKNIKKVVRVVPYVPESIRSMFNSYFGAEPIHYEEHSVKDLEKLEITFQIKNVPLVGQYIDVAGGKLCFIPVNDKQCRLEGYFDLRVTYPVLGYYIAQVIRTQAIKDLTSWPDIAVEYIKNKNAK